MSTRKQERRSAVIQFRISAEDKDLISRAAREAGTDMSAFITLHAKQAAQFTLAQAPVRHLDVDAFATLVAMLDAPAQSLPDLAALAGEPSPFSDR